MPMPTRWLARASAALLSASFLVSLVAFAPPGAEAQAAAKATARVKASAQSSAGKKEPATAQPQLPPRIPFTAAEAAVAAIPGIPEARFWGDTEADFKNALPAQPGPCAQMWRWPSAWQTRPHSGAIPRCCAPWKRRCRWRRTGSFEPSSRMR